jgi:hypothetical protein
VEAFKNYHPDVQPVIGNFNFGLSSENDHLRLIDPWNKLVSMVEYSSNPPWPQNVSGSGRTAEVLDFTGDLNNGSNWRDGCLGGSPGRFPLPCHDTLNMIVTEIYYNSTGESDTGDWIELLNNDTLPVLMNGWKLANSDQKDIFHFPDGIWIQPGEYILIVQDSAKFIAVHDSISGFVGNFEFDLSEIADDIFLNDIFDQEIVALNYQSGAPWPFNFSGSQRTIERIDHNQSHNDPLNWQIGCRGGSPGSAPVNCPNDFKVVFTEFNYKSFHKFDTKDWVEIYNYDTVPADLSYWKFLNGNGIDAFTFPPGFQLEPSRFLVICSDTAEFSKFNPDVNNLIGNFGFDLSEVGDDLRLYDPWDNQVSLVEYSTDLPWPQLITGTGRTAEVIDYTADVNNSDNWKTGCLIGSPGMFPLPCNDTVSVIVSEINYSISDDFPTGAWFEIFNNNDFIVEMDGWSFRNSIAYNFFEFQSGTQILPGEYLVVVEDSSKFLTVHDTIPNFVGSFGFGLSEVSDEIHLYDFFEQQIVFVNYLNTEPWPLNNPGSGRSIELIDPEEDLNDPLNWKIGCKGGSPGMAYIDCDDFSIPENLLEKLTVNVFPNPFTQNFSIELISNERMKVDILLKNSLGYEIKQVFSGEINQGKEVIEAQISNPEKGIYFLEIISGGFAIHYKVIAY